MNDLGHSELSDVELRVRALESILAEKGYIDPATVDSLVEAYETRIGPRNGAGVLARARAPKVHRRTAGGRDPAGSCSSSSRRGRF